MEKNIVVINKKISSETREIMTSGDIIVPDIKPDIVSIIDSNAIPYVYKEDVSNGRIRTDGNIDTYIVYLADNGDTRSIQTTLTFSESFESDLIKETSFSRQKIILESVDTKVLNERKLSIKAKLRIEIEVFEKEEIEINNEVPESEKMEILKESMEIKSVIGINKVKTTIKEDISVDGSLEVAEILRTNVEIINIENKISYNKVLAKADADVKIVFLTEDNKIGVAKSQIPIMSFIDMEQITDKNICNIDYSIKNMLFKPNSKEMHSVSCQIDFEVMCEAYEMRNLEIVQDMYGIKNNIEFSKKNVSVELACEENCENVKLNERILVEDILNIYDVDKKVKVLNTNKSGGYCNYECELILTVYYEADNRNGLNIKNINLPFMVKFEGEQEKLSFRIEKNEFTINNENVDCSFEIKVKKENTNMKQISIIENAEIKEKVEDNDYKMYMYFAKQGDSIWSIAKKFKVCMSDILKLNDLECSDKIVPGQRLYIMR